MADSLNINRGHSDTGASPDLEADVLVLGGGPAGCWAAVSAAAQGARVLLADKGFCGTSGATAPSGTNVWSVPPDPQARAAAKASRFELGGRLAEPAWMDRVLEQTWTLVQHLQAWGYPFPLGPDGRTSYVSLQGAEYMRLMRRRVKESGGRILDHSPALELLVDEAGAVCGAAGVKHPGGEPWRARAGAVVMATGGCAFQSHALGCDVLTGDGLLMGVEVGAELSGMEFSNAYGLGPAFSSVTKSLFYRWATFYRADGTVIEGAGSSRGRWLIARTLQTEPVLAQLDQADAQVQSWMRATQKNFFLPFDRMGIDPFRQRFPVSLRLEGTVRGTGGLDVVDDRCSTRVPGLFAAGDAATRERICGGFTGGGSHNAAWALSSGFWAGAGAAEHARRHRRPIAGPVSGAASVALRRAPGRGHAGWRPEEVVRAVQDEVFPYAKNWTRQAEVLTPSLQRLDAVWARLREGPPADGSSLLKAREAAAMLATARWMYRSALARRESRGMHYRVDHVGSDPAQRQRLISSGLDEVRLRTQAISEGWELASLEATA